MAKPSYFSRLTAGAAAAGPGARSLTPPRVLFRETPSPELSEQVDLYRAAQPALALQAPSLGTYKPPALQPPVARTIAAPSRLDEPPGRRTAPQGPIVAPETSIPVDTGGPIPALEPARAERPSPPARTPAPHIAEPAPPPARPTPATWPDGPNLAPAGSQAKLWIGALEVRITPPAVKPPARPSAPATPAPSRSRSPQPLSPERVARSFRAFGLRQS